MSVLRLVLFDLDGSLADTAADIANATNRVLAEAGCPGLSEKRVRALVSSGARAIVRSAFATPPSEEKVDQMVRKLFDYYAERPAAETRVFSGLRELIADLGTREIRWGVVTNKPQRLAMPIVAALDLSPEAVCIIGGDSLARRKPDPLPLVAACSQAGIDVSEAIYVGDARIDVEAARAAGMEIAVAGFGYAPPPSQIAPWDEHFYAGSVEELGRILLARTCATS